MQSNPIPLYIISKSGPDWSCDWDQADLFLKISFATNNHLIQYHLQHVGRWGSLTQEGFSLGLHTKLESGSYARN